jgi:poly(A) polymerase/tRNA nucleotidyltransferase (CCA-adding enzyme)
MSRTMKVLQELDEETKGNVYLVGGYVRDLLRRKKPKDVDAVIKNLSLKEIQSYLEKRGRVRKTFVSGGKSKMTVLTFKAKGDDLEVQITLPRGRNNLCRKYNTLKQDAYFRDFTINAMYLPIRHESKKDLIEFFNGCKDVKRRVIRAVGNPAERMIESPVRMLRAISLAARTGYKIQNRLKATLAKRKDLLRKVPAEAVREELNEILLSKKPSKHLKLMQRLGMLEVILPELNACAGVKQDKRHHKYDVFRHCVYTCDNIEPDLKLRLAALFHDVGKPQTRETIDGKITFHRHEIVSVDLTRNALRRLRYSNEIVREVTKLVELHMYHYTREFSDAAVRRFIKRAGVTEEDLEDIGQIPLFKLRMAERLGNGYKTIPVTERQKDFEKRIVDVFRKSSGFSTKDLKVNGSDLMKVFNLKEGKEIGVTLSHLLEIILEKPEMNNKEDLVALAAKFLMTKKLD